MPSKSNRKYDKKEHLTNWYMINLCWGILGILALTAVYRGYRSINSLMYMQTLMWVFASVFAIGAVILFIFSNSSKHKKRLINYGVFMIICTAVALWLALYNFFRPYIEKMIQTILSNSNFTVDSYWNIRVPMILIVIYLLVAFIWYIVKITRN